jgi:hypothetical protein
VQRSIVRQAEFWMPDMVFYNNWVRLDGFQSARYASPIGGGTIKNERLNINDFEQTSLHGRITLEKSRWRHCLALSVPQKL